ncbi:hypothetical protein [[Clostridium] scindens]|uniref:hypothetical protein n=1 Tax=Clostridium scindens (strain JCM 10418 / VPI 12708) TaxID=29347 RepID=UPI003A429993
MIKSTAVGFTIGVIDLLAKARILGGSSLNYFEAYVAVGLIYWVIIVVLDQLQKIVEKHIYRYV